MERDIKRTNLFLFGKPIKAKDAIGLSKIQKRSKDTP